MSSVQLTDEKEIYYNNPKLLTSCKSKSSRDVRKNVKFTPYCPIELNNKYNNDSDNDISIDVSIQTKCILQKKNSKEPKKVSFSCKKFENNENKEKEKEIKDKEYNILYKKNQLHKSNSIELNYDEIIEKLKNNPPQINKKIKNISNEIEKNHLKNIHLSKSLNPRNTKLNFTNPDNSKESNNEYYIIKKAITNNIFDINNNVNLRRKSLQFGLLLSHAEEKVKHFTNTEIINDFYEYTEKCMSMILDLEPSKQNQIKEKVNFNFPKNESYKKIALFDLDETLVHCTGEINSNKDKKYKNIVEVTLPSRKKVEIGINIRPFWKEALNLIKEKYHIVIFTASHQSYANAVLDFMDPNKEYTKYRLYRNDCVLTNMNGVKFYIKDLNIFDKYYDLKDIVLIDNSVLSFAYHLDNGIPIVPYYDADEDGELEILACYLLSIYDNDDLRVANKKHIRIEFYLDEARKNREEMNEENSSSHYSSDSEDDDNNRKSSNIKNIKIDNDKENKNEKENDNNLKINKEIEKLNNNEDNNNSSSLSTNQDNQIKNNNDDSKTEKIITTKYNSLNNISSVLNNHRRIGARKKTSIGLDIKKMWGDLKKEFNIILKNN